MARTTQTTRINGKRVRLVTTTSAAGTRVQMKPAAVEEWLLQAAGVRAMRAMPEYGKLFTLAGDMNAARRSMREQVKAKATGLTSGEHDKRVYMIGGRLGLIEYKNADGRLSKEQIKRHADLAALGFTLQAVIKAATEEEAARLAVETVRGWLAANDNHSATTLARDAIGG